MVDRSLTGCGIARIELAVLLLLFEVLVWFVAPHTVTPGGAVLFLACLGMFVIHVFVGSARLYSDGLTCHTGLGPLLKGRLRWETWRPGALLYGFTLLAGVVSIYFLGNLGSTAPAQEWQAVILRFGRYLSWAAVQTYLYFEFIRPRLLLALGPGRPHSDYAIALALIYAIVHLPNPYTMTGSAIAGFIWSMLYARFPNFAWVVLSHAVFGTCVQIFTDWPIRVGLAFSEPYHYAFRSALRHLLLVLK